MCACFFSFFLPGRSFVHSLPLDLALLQSILEEYKRKRECGELLLDQHQRRIDAALAPVSLKAADSEKISFGDVVILKHSDSGIEIVTQHPPPFH